MAESGCPRVSSFLGVCLTSLFYNKLYFEIGKEHIGDQCEHRFEWNDRRDNSQTLHGKTPAGESSDKSIHVKMKATFDKTMEMLSIFTID